MSDNRFIGAGKALVDRVPLRARWSLADQVLVSGTNALTAVILVRALGLAPFGIYTLVLFAVQLIAIPQASGIIAPTMSHFDRRGAISRQGYLSAILVHQGLYAAAVALAFVGVSFVYAPAGVTNPALIAAVCAATQLQDLARRFFFVTDRPFMGFACDVVAYGVRLAALAGLAFAGMLTVDVAWYVIIATSLAGLLLLLPDLAPRLDWSEIGQVTRLHRTTAGWTIGNHIAWWLSDTYFVLLIGGATLDVAQLGAARAVQSIVQVLNVLLQSLENFAPSAVAKALVAGGGAAAWRYVKRLALVTGAASAATVLLLLLLAEPVMQIVYGRTFQDQLAFIALFGGFQILANITQILNAGMRGVSAMRAAFFNQLVFAGAALPLALYMIGAAGLIAALTALLAVRVLYLARLGLLLRTATKAIGDPAP